MSKKKKDGQPPKFDPSRHRIADSIEVTVPLFAFDPATGRRDAYPVTFSFRLDFEGWEEFSGEETEGNRLDACMRRFLKGIQGVEGIEPEEDGDWYGQALSIPGLRHAGLLATFRFIQEIGESFRTTVRYPLPEPAS